MSNELRTIFIFDDADASRRIDLNEKKLFALNTDLNNLGKGLTVGKTIADDLGKAGKAVEDFKAKTDDLSRPTFGGAYVAETKKINAAFESNKTAAESLKETVETSLRSTTGLANAGKNSLLEIEKYAKETAAAVEPLKDANIKITVSDKEFDTISKKAGETRQSFEAIAKTRLDNGQVNNLTKEVVKAGERSRELQSRISDIKREINSPTRKSSIAYLTDDLRAAESETDSLNRKLKALPSSTSGNAKGGRGRPNKEFNRALLEITDDFAPAGFNRPFNAVGKELLAISAVSATTLITFGAIAAAGYGIVQVTKNIREEAERYLKVQNSITGAINNQILSQKKGLTELQETREEAAKNRQFNQNLGDSSVEELKRQKTNLERQRDLIPATLPILENGKVVSKTNELFSKVSQQLLAVDAQIEAAQQNIGKAANGSFIQRNEDFKKTQQNQIEAERAYIEKRKQFSKNLLLLKDDLRDSLVSFASSENPLVKQMSDFETATERAQLKFGVFGDDVVNKIAAIERANLTKAINLQKFENNLGALKFDQQAQQLAATPARQFADFARKLESVNRKVEFVSTTNDLTRKISEADFYANRFNPNNPKIFAEFNRRGPNDDITDAGISIRNAVSDIRDLKSINLEGTGLDGREAVINKILESIPPRDELLRRLSSPNLRGDSQNLLEEQANALRIKKDIERNKFSNFIEDQRTAEFGKQFAREQIGLINKSGLTAQEKAQQRLAVTDALGNDLDPGLKRQKIEDFVASANEKRNQDNKTAKNIEDIKTLVDTLVKALTENGTKADVPPAQVNVTLNGVEATVSQNNLPPAATSKDTAKAYSGGTFYDEYQNQ